MKKFCFKLQGLLNIKKAYEKEIHYELMKIQSLCSEKEVQIEKVEQKIQGWSEHYNKVLRMQTPSAQLGIIDQHLQSLYRYKEQLVIGLEVLTRKKRDVIHQYEEVSREVKMIEHLEKKKKDEYQQEMISWEQKQNDEMAVVRYARERSSM